jgi:DNA polymerase/3'-5' exonuclease PolX
MFNASFDLTPSPSHETSETPSAAAAPLNNARLAAGLERIAELIADGPRGRREALRRAAAVIRWSSQSVVGRVEQEGVEGVHQLGLDYELAGVVTDWVRSGRLRWLERLEARQQRRLLDLPGIGPKLADDLRQVLGVEDVPSLARALREGQLARVCGFGAKRLKALEAALAVHGAPA